ncbi:alpha/beta hydrolase [Caballeronia pedi]|uniref:alpha/beta hydrolase n=1 Tax=Caballeronia pedi TaxID=1777141 RepID=UPI000772BD68|nr:alpha/beta hydrolase fold domain-containing protein [Caballeronia pedi]
MADAIKGILGVDPATHADDDMKAVLDALASLNLKPIEECTPVEARQQPIPADAVKKVVQERNISVAPHVAAIQTRDNEIQGAEGHNPARIYTPSVDDPFPVVLYFRGGGWVIADLDVYDATPRAIEAQANAVVVSAHYPFSP